ncbi:MAG TPA: DUF1501 domain-containing protein [Gemmataceae bacterium]|jgi:uncharacterized protein (DUF1501 family)
MISRRDFLGRSALIALAPTVPHFLARSARAAAPRRDGRVLVVVELSGGNDGINTSVPFKDEGYLKFRKALRLPEKQLLKIDDQIALHPALGDAMKLLESKRLAIVQGVGYPNPNRSHARSMAIWQTARFDPEEHKSYGWLGRALDVDAASSLFVGTTASPIALRGRRSAASALSRLEEFHLTGDAAAARAMASTADADDLSSFVQRSFLNAYTTSDRLAEAAQVKDAGVSYPSTGLANRLQLVARLLKSGFAARVYYTSQGSYDTHAAQLQTHANLLRELGGALRAFLDDLAAAKLADRVAVLVFSEFGRQVRENASAGTDHGTAAPVFLAGPGVRSGLVGTAPNLLDLVGNAPKMTMDFRRVYAAVLDDWLDVASKDALGGTFERLPLFRS